MVSILTMSLDDVRADREAAEREQAARKNKYEQDKAALAAEFEAEMKSLAALLIDLEAAERVLLRRQQQSRPVPNGHDEHSEPEGVDDEAPEDEIEAENGEDEETGGEGDVGAADMTQKEMVLAAVRVLRERGEQSMRYHIDQFIRREFHAQVPLTNISTYLRRLKDAGLVENPGQGLDWYPVRRAGR